MKKTRDELEAENNSLRALMRDVAQDCREIATMKIVSKVEARTWLSIAYRLERYAKSGDK